ncbi:unnamed protein product [Brassica napus]|uniref:(rape) hypothetical protein n=1 Tax=Brassica napus TaxID=3708 RepID=A0A816KM57_BRANA|nr:unnamed protein product [Brassica napus]
MITVDNFCSQNRIFNKKASLHKRCLIWEDEIRQKRLEAMNQQLRDSLIEGVTARDRPEISYCRSSWSFWDKG